MKENFTREEVRSLLKRFMLSYPNDNDRLDGIINNFLPEEKKYPEGILQFKTVNANIATMRNDTPIYSNYQECCKYHLETAPHSKIWQVKNSKGETFTVGDKILCGMDYTQSGDIVKFYINDNIIWATIGPNYIHHRPIDQIKPFDQKLKTVYPEGILVFEYAKCNAKKIYLRHHTGTYQDWCQTCIENNYKIWSVQNEKEEIFRVGDFTDKGPIEGFSACAGDQQIWVYIKRKYSNSEYHGFCGDNSYYTSLYMINDVSHIKTFKTEDGFDIAPTDLVWWLDCSVNNKPSGMKTIHQYEYNTTCIRKEKYKAFKTKENAEKYAEENMPLFSKADIYNAKVGPNENYNNNPTIEISLKKLGL